MKIWTLLPLLVGAGAIFHAGRTGDREVLLLTGDSRGTLSPCGCTKPMTGGVKRLVTAVKAYGLPGQTSLLVNGDLTGNPGEQDELKAQALAEILSGLNPVAVRLGEGDARNPASASVFQSFLGDKVLTQDRATDSRGFRFLADPNGSAVKQAVTDGLRPVALIEGDESAAKALARKFPELALIEYRNDGRGNWLREGSTLLVTPGSKLRDLVVVVWDEGSQPTPKVVALDEQVADDPAASEIYRAYLGRVDKRHLLEKVERSGDQVFAGTARCVSCHSAAGTVWQHSAHSQALKALESEGHGRDPECVSCHVVGLAQTQGFQSRKQTPDLANVGCESCHGAGGPHAESPKNFALIKVSEKTCVSCHTADQSPGFRFEAYWNQIKH